MKPLWKRKLFWLACYLCLLMASTLMRSFFPQSPSLGEDQKTLSLPLRDGAQKVPEREIIIAYRDLPADTADAPILLMLHGSPMASESLRPLAEELRGEARLVIPDLPGFGASTQQLPDYSLRTHAYYLRDFMDALGIKQAQVIGYSMGSGVALRLYEIAPKQVSSLILLAGVGVQETELTGNYTLNHALHGLQLAVLWIGQNLLPHFGTLDTVLLDTQYARNFYDSDQRELRTVLSRFHPPMLILHAKGDRLVPIETAREHHRLVPQSELKTYSGSHITPIRKPERLAPAIQDFIASVASGKAATHAEASQARLEAARAPFGEHRLTFTGSALVLMLSLLALATFASEDLACIGAGILAAGGTIHYGHAVLACFVGIFVGDSILFFIGKCIGRPALGRAPLRWFISPAQVDLSQQWLHKRGALLILLTRFLPGSRLPTYFASGMLGVSVMKFLFFFALASALWTPLLVGLAYFSGEWLLETFSRYERFALPALIGLMVLVYFCVHLLLPLLSWRGRRSALGRWRRLTHWEYWSRSRMYAPVLSYIFCVLAWRYGIRSCTVANPAFDGAGGLIGESKTRILRHLREHGAPVAPFTVLPAGEKPQSRFRLLEAFLGSTAGDPYPCVLKPEVGQRGEGVAIIRNSTHAIRWLEDNPGEAIVQTYVPGVEYGIFYARMPGESRGKIISVTSKQYTYVLGDGKQTIRDLILRDERAVCMAPFFFKQHADQLARIPAQGEKFMLSEIGTHCRGALFLDGKDILTPELEDAMNRFCPGIEGFYFGRFDMKAPSKEAFMSGESLQILELNGLTSESTHMYQPGYTLWNAYRTLFRQWHLAYRIGYENRKRGHQPMSRPKLIRYLLRHLP